MAIEGETQACPAAHARLEGAHIVDFDWTDADVEGAAFVNCRIEDAQLSGANLRGARFEGCRILRCRFAHAELEDAVLEDCRFDDPQTQTGAAFAFSRLEGARFLRCDLSHARFDRSDLHDVLMEDCNLRGARFHQVAFAKSFGRKVVRTTAAFRRCNFHLADLSGLTAPGCDFSGSLFREADLSRADLEGALLVEADLFGAILEDAKLADADLRGAGISGLDLAALTSRAGLKITPDQQYALLTALGIDVRPETSDGRPDPSAPVQRTKATPARRDRP